VPFFAGTAGAVKSGVYEARLLAELEMGMQLANCKTSRACNLHGHPDVF
jgi:hypothetical protein